MELFSKGFIASIVFFFHSELVSVVLFLGSVLLGFVAYLRAALFLESSPTTERANQFINRNVWISSALITSLVIAVAFTVVSKYGKFYITGFWLSSEAYEYSTIATNNSRLDYLLAFGMNTRAIWRDAIFWELVIYSLVAAIPISFSVLIFYYKQRIRLSKQTSAPLEEGVNRPS